MRKLLVLLFLPISLTLSGTVFYLSPNGNDSNPGTINLPFFSLNKAWKSVIAGDTIYLRGGTYNYSVTQELLYKDGTPERLINIWNYPGERPVISYAGQTFTKQVIGIHLQQSDYIYIKGIRITSIAQPVSGNITMVGILLKEDVNYSVFEKIETDHIGGWGIAVKDGCSNLLFLNCDSHHNSDPYSAIPYDGADGFLSGSPNSTKITFRGCRSWWNSDDGWDLRGSNGEYIFENCWAFWNGYKPDTFTEAGNGIGFKLGGKTAPATTNTLRFVYNSISFQNRIAGFDPQPDGSDLYFSSLFYNCVAYNNGYYGFVCDWYSQKDVLKNCISYLNGYKNILSNSYTSQSNNTWNTGFTVTSADFLSTDAKGVDGPRDSEGRMPILDFLNLASGSALIDAGTQTGLPFSGSAPDIGAFEKSVAAPLVNQAPTISISSPTVNSSFIAPATLTIEAAANDPDGTINKVEFFKGAIKIGEKETGPYSFSWIEINEGTYTLTAVATDNLNAKTVSAAVTVIVNKPVAVANQLPVISISSPTASASFIAPATLTIEAAANDPDGTIIKVEFFKGNVKIGEKSTGPFSYSWTEINEGTYTLTAVATDNLNAKTVSAGVNVTVNKTVEVANQLPVISISSPSKGSSINSLASLIIEADAFDPDGTIEKVELFNGAAKMGEITAAPYSFTLKDLPAGDYSLTAVATDNLKATSISDILALKVTSYDENREYFNLYPNPNDGRFKIDFSTPFEAEYYTVTVINIIGNTVYKEQLQKEDLPKQFDLSSLDPGIYIVMIAGDAIVTTQKFIKS